MSAEKGTTSKKKALPVYEGAGRVLTLVSLAVVVTFLLSWLYRSVLLSLGVSFLVAYLLSPFVNFMEKLRVRRSISALVIISFFVGAAAFLVLQIGPVVLDQLFGMIHAAPRWVESLRLKSGELVTELLQATGVKDPGLVDKTIRGFDFVGQLMGQFQAAAHAILQTGADVVNRVVNFVLIPLVSFVIIVEQRRMQAFAWTLVPDDLQDSTRVFVARVDETLRAVIKGHIKVALCLSVFYVLGFSMMGLQGWLAIGIATGLCRVIPYLDVFVGVLLGLAAILTAGEGWGEILALLGVIGIVQLIDGALITPRLIGEKAGLHPVFAIITIIAAGQTFGFLGVLLAIPAAAVLKTLFELAWPKIQRTKLFQGD